MKYLTKKNRGGAVYSVLVKKDAREADYKTEDGIFGQVSSNLSKRFRFAFSAPCYHCKLFKNLGFMGDTKAAQAILEGTYKFPADKDPATRLLLEEASYIYKNMIHKQIVTYVTVEDFQYYCQRQNERISSSVISLSMGHYKAVLYKKDLALLHAAKLTSCARIGVPLNRWGFGVTVLLEKICDNNYIDRLRVICLSKADFNWWNKLVFT